MTNGSDGSSAHEGPASPGYAIRAARLLDPETGVYVTGQYLLITGGRISGRSPAPPDNVPVIDAGELTLLPGLIDAHTHMLLRPGDQAWPPAITGKSLPFRMAEGVAAAYQALDLGFTTIRDLGNEGAAGCDVALRDAVERDVVPGPRMLVATDAITITGGIMSLAAEVNPDLGLPDPAGIADSRDELIRQVRRQVRAGADWIKLYCTAAMRQVDQLTMATPAQFDTAEVAAAVAEAARFGRDVAAHAYGGPGAVAAIEGGARSLEHGPLLAEQELALLGEKGTYWVPTLAVYARRGDTDFQRRFAARHESAFRRGRDLGLKIAFGTDVGSFAHGEQLDEFTLMVRYGMTPLEAIRSATTIAAGLLRQPGEIGTLADGARADVIAVEGDPLTDIEALRQVRLVIRDGAIYRADPDAITMPATAPVMINQD